MMSNFSFSHGVFKRLVLQTHKNCGLFGKRLMGHLLIFLYGKKALNLQLLNNSELAWVPAQSFYIFLYNLTIFCQK